MSGPGSGKYLIVPANIWAPLPRPIGGDYKDPFVIVGGKNRVWTAEELDNGNYHLSLVQPGGSQFSHGGKGDDLVTLSPEPGVWTIDKKPDGTYSIAVPTVDWPTKGWTVDSTEPGTKVKLETYGPGAKPGQLWNFIHYDE